MKPGYLYITAALLLIFSSCSKNTTSKIPHISITYFGPMDRNKPYIQPKDTAVLEFHIIDGDGDLGSDNANNDIFIKDLRFELPAQGYAFPIIDRSIEDPSKGIEGDCVFFFVQPISPRMDSLHAKSDTVKMELYILDRAGNKSNTEVTLPVEVRP